MFAYALSKAMIFKLAEFINVEGKDKNISATVIVPSTIDTPANRAVLEEDFAKLRILLARGLPDNGASRTVETAEGAPPTSGVSDPPPSAPAPSPGAGAQKAPVDAVSEQLHLW